MFMFSWMSGTITYILVNKLNTLHVSWIINESTYVLCQSECAYVYQTEKHRFSQHIFNEIAQGGGKCAEFSNNSSKLYQDISPSPFHQVFNNNKKRINCAWRLLVQRWCVIHRDTCTEHGYLVQEKGQNYASQGHGTILRKLSIPLTGSLPLQWGRGIKSIAVFIL